MRILYIKPYLKDLSVGSRIAFIRQFRRMTQDELASKLGVTGESKRRTITRYEKNNRVPKDKRLQEIADILQVNVNAIKEYDYKDKSDIIYTLLWLDELIPNYKIDISEVNSEDNDYVDSIKRFIQVWEKLRLSRKNNGITYEKYLNWKLNLNVKENK